MARQAGATVALEWTSGAQIILVTGLLLETEKDKAAIKQAKEQRCQILTEQEFQSVIQQYQAEKDKEQEQKEPRSKQEEGKQQEKDKKNGRRSELARKAR